MTVNVRFSYPLVLMRVFWLLKCVTFSLKKILEALSSRDCWSLDLWCLSWHNLWSVIMSFISMHFQSSTEDHWTQDSYGHFYLHISRLISSSEDLRYWYFMDFWGHNASYDEWIHVWLVLLAMCHKFRCLQVCFKNW